MPSVIDISLNNLLIFSTFLLLPAFLLYRWQLVDLSKNTLISVIRMTAQLMLVGLYLKYLFELNHLWLNLIWLLVMITVANISIVKGAGLRLAHFFRVTQVSLMMAIITVCLMFLMVLVQPAPFLDARYLIPIAGMLLGNCLQGNIRALETFYSDLRREEARYHSDLLLGATVSEAVQPFFRRAVRVSMTPVVGTMATLGIVSLPGMMTGQILGGATPLIAAKYQVAIMVAIYLSMICAITVNLRLSLCTAFSASGLLREDILCSKLIKPLQGRLK